VQGTARTDADEALVFVDDEGARARLARGGLFFCTPEKLACEGFRARLRALHARQPFAYFVLDVQRNATSPLPEARVAARGLPGYARVLLQRDVQRVRVGAARRTVAPAAHVTLSSRRRAAQPAPQRALPQQEERGEPVLGGRGTPGASGAGVVARAVRGFAGGEVVVFANVRATVEELAGEAGEHRARADGCLLPRGVLGC